MPIPTRSHRSPSLRAVAPDGIRPHNLRRHLSSTLSPRSWRETFRVGRLEKSTERIAAHEWYPVDKTSVSPRAQTVINLCTVRKANVAPRRVHAVVPVRAVKTKIRRESSQSLDAAVRSRRLSHTPTSAPSVKTPIFHPTGSLRPLRAPTRRPDGTPSSPPRESRRLFARTSSRRLPTPCSGRALSPPPPRVVHPFPSSTPRRLPRSFPPFASSRASVFATTVAHP